VLKNKAHRQECEAAATAIFHERGIAAVSACGLIPSQGRPSYQMLAEAIDASGADAVLTIHPVEPEPGIGNDWQETATLENVTLYPGHWMPALFPHWDLYSHYRSASFPDPPYHPAATHHLIQVSLFETATRRLIWAGKVELTTKEQPAAELGSVAEAVAEMLATSGLVAAGTNGLAASRMQWTGRGGMP
jgi:hypothetical protein